MTQFAVLSVFHVEKSEEFQANALRYIGPNDDNYYLRIDEDGRVKLVVSKKSISYIAGLPYVIFYFILFYFIASPEEDKQLNKHQNK